MVTPTNGTLNFRGIRSKRLYGINVYISDVVGAKVTFEPAGLAGTGSDTFWVPPEDVYLERAAITTGPTVAKALVLTQDGSPLGGGVISFAQNLDTLSNPPMHAIPFPAKVNIGAKQV